MTEIRMVMVALLAALAITGCERPRAGSSGSNWLACETLADCGAAEAAVSCSAAGFCEDARGELIAVTEGEGEASCLAPVYRGTCIEDVTVELTACVDGTGRCTWNTEANAFGETFTVFEWANGTRYEEHGRNALIIAATGERCTIDQVDTADCSGVRTEAGGRWYELCALARDEPGFRYSCDNGDEFELSTDEIAGSPSATCEPSPRGTLDDCVDYRGMRYGDRMAADGGI